MKNGKRKGLDFLKFGSDDDNGERGVGRKDRRSVLWALCTVLMVAGGIAGLTRVQADGNAQNQVFARINLGPHPESPLPSSEGWEPYLPTADDVVLTPDLEKGRMYIDITFPSDGYRIVKGGYPYFREGTKPDGSSYYEFHIQDVRLQKSVVQPTALVPVTQRLDYEIPYGDKTSFVVFVNYDGVSVKLKNIIVYKNNPPTPAQSGIWEEYLPTEDQVKVSVEPKKNLVYVDLTFPGEGYRIVDTGYLKYTFGRNDALENVLQWETLGLQIEKLVGSTTGSAVKQRITYDIQKDTMEKTREFFFQVFYQGIEVQVGETVVFN